MAAAIGRWTVSSSRRGLVEIIDPTGDQERVIVEYGTGHFTGEISVLTGAASW
ncbi:MAG: hypothetical protein WDO13_06615 [Verrucomicrobiota bacterium]